MSRALVRVVVAPLSATGVVSAESGNWCPVYVSVSRLRVAASRADELVRAFRDRAHLVDHAEGFIDLQVWRSDRDKLQLLMVSRWRTRSDFVRYMRSGAHWESHERIPLALRDAVRLERLEHLEGYEVVAE